MCVHNLCEKLEEKKLSLVKNVQSKSQQYNKHTSFSLDHFQQQHVYPHSQSSKQQLRHSKQARAAQSWERRIAHWLFICEQVWMKHMQQQRSTTLLQQFVAALNSISVGFVSSLPGGMFSAVALQLPNPTPRFPNMIVSCKSIFLRDLILLNTCFH